MSNLPACCMDLNIHYLDLLFPERLTPDARAFCDAHGIFTLPLAELRRGARDLGEGKIELRHRCDQLLDDGRCAIYAERPKICREYDCSKREDCACHGDGFISVDSLFAHA